MTIGTDRQRKKNDQDKQSAMYTAMREQAFTDRNEKLDPRCSGALYADLLEAARLIGCNRYKDARSLIEEAFGFQESDA